MPDAFFDELRALQHQQHQQQHQQQQLHPAELEPAFRETFDPEKARRDRLLHWLMRSTQVSASELRQGAERGVLMVGDAVHAQPILGGEGANAAIEDGVEIGEWIAERGVEGLVDFYSDERVERWRSGVEKSERRLEEMHTEAKSVL